MTTIHDGVPCYVAEPDGAPRGAVIVIHEIWGLADHITDVADRFATEGYLAVAPDLLSGIGIDPTTGDDLRQLMFQPEAETRSAGQPDLREKLAPIRTPEFASWAVMALKAVVDDVLARPGVDGHIGVVGFCFGGTFAFALAAADPRLTVAVPFYGQPPESDQIPSIACPVRAFYGEADDRLMATLPDLRANMAAAGVDFTATVYPAARHAFFNDTNPVTYDAAAAADAWTRTLVALAETIG
jgi:carboxymethylenebutenolidase